MRKRQSSSAVKDQVCEYDRIATGGAPVDPNECVGKHDTLIEGELIFLLARTHCTKATRQQKELGSFRVDRSRTFRDDDCRARRWVWTLILSAASECHFRSTLKPGPVSSRSPESKLTRCLHWRTMRGPRNLEFQ